MITFATDNALSYRAYQISEMTCISNISLARPCYDSVTGIPEEKQESDTKTQKVRTFINGDKPDNHSHTAVTFLEFVTIKLAEYPSEAIGHKALKSFCRATENTCHSSDKQLAQIWLASMIEKGIARSSRKRYVGKLKTLYEEYSGADSSKDNPFAILSDSDTPAPHTAIENTATLSKNIDTLIADAKTRPSIALFLYLLFNPDTSLDEAINMEAGNMETPVELLHEILKTDAIHHRRKYLFALNQSHKRMPQLRREISCSVELALARAGVKSGPFQAHTATELWIAQARKNGITIPEIRAMIPQLPPAYRFMDNVEPDNLSPDIKNGILRHVANAFGYNTYRWYAIKLRRGIPGSTAIKAIKEKLPEAAWQTNFFYPEIETARRDGKKIIRLRSPLIPGIIFARALPVQAQEIDRILRGQRYGRILRQNSSAKAEFSVIPQTDMHMFQCAAGQFSADMKVEIIRYAPIQVGRRVRITNGPLQGLEGTVTGTRTTPTADLLFAIRLSSSLYMKWQAALPSTSLELI